MKKILAKAYLWLILLVLYLPIFFIAVFSFTEAKSLGNWTGFSLNLYKNLFTGSMQNSAGLISAVENTLLIALVASLIATLLGLVIVLTGLPVPKVAVELFSSLSGATMPMSMMVIGASLGTVSLLDAFRKPKLALLSAVRLILIPVLTWAVCRFLTSDPVLLMTCVIIAASPSAVIVSVIAIQYGRDGVFASEAVQHSTICSMVSIPLLIEIFSRLG